MIAWIQLKEISGRESQGAWCQEKLIDSKRPVIQRGLEHGSKGITISGAVTRQVLVKTLWARRRLNVCSSDCKVWKLEMAL
jgi:hypothetical protein